MKSEIPDEFKPFITTKGFESNKKTCIVCLGRGKVQMVNGRARFWQRCYTCGGTGKVQIFDKLQ